MVKHCPKQVKVAVDVALIINKSWKQQTI